MTTSLRHLYKSILGLLSAVVLITACSDVNEIELYNPDDEGGPTPTISALNPQASAFAGFGTVTITGTNFSPNQGENFVYFDGVKATIVQESATSITVQSPNYPKEDITVRVATQGATAFSNPVTYTLNPLFTLNPEFPDYEVPYSLAVDRSNNLYYTFTSNNANQGIHVLTPDGNKSVYSSAVQFFNWSGFKIGPNGHVYLARRLRALFRAEPGAREVVWSQLPAPAVFVDFDFDEFGNAWAAGNRLAHINLSNNTATPVSDFNGSINAVRYFSGHLYLAGTKNTKQVVLRYPVNANGTLGPEEEYFNFTDQVSTTINLLSMVIAENGTVYLGTDAINNPIYTLETNKAISPLYPGVLNGPIPQMSWDNDMTLYAIRGATPSYKGAILKINMGSKSAPYFGRQ